MIRTRSCKNLVFTFLPFFLLCCFSCSSDPTDADVEKEIREKLAAMQGYDAVQVAVRDNIVFLTGQCVGEGCAKQLEEHIREVDGVIAVENDLTEGVIPPR